MARKKGSDEDSVYYRSDRNKWIAQYYYDVDLVTIESIKNIFEQLNPAYLSENIIKYFIIKKEVKNLYNWSE